MAAKRPPPPEPIGPAIAVPWFLAIGPCSEVWTPDRRAVSSWPDYAVQCVTRHRDARSAWLQLHGIDADDPRVPQPVRWRSAPWSFRWLEATDPDRLAARLHSAGLPPQWLPRPAPAALRSRWRDYRTGEVPAAVRRILTDNPNR